MYQSIMKTIPNREPEMYQKSMSGALKTFVYNQPSNKRFEAGYKLTDMLVFCRYGSIPCSEDDFTYAYNYEYLNCYKLNTNGSWYSGKVGSEYGLQITFYVGGPNNYDWFSDGRGIRFMIYNSTIEQPFIKDYGSVARPGVLTEVSIKKSAVSRLGPPYELCQPDLSSNARRKTDLMRIMFENLTQQQYNQVYCLNLCLQMSYIKNCSW